MLLYALPIGGVTADENETPGTKPLEGKYISVMGDSISTYMGWSDSKPITDESCAYRYGEPYYGPVGSDCHNTELLVEDTWWHQAAQELGAQILVNNAGNSSGLLHASYPADADWHQYLQDMLAYKTRPYFMGTEEIDPDIIALYIGSHDVRMSPSTFGTLEAVDFDTLIVPNGDGTFTYAEPATVAEAYCILLHKITVTYPNAEVVVTPHPAEFARLLRTSVSRVESDRLGAVQKFLTAYPVTVVLKGHHTIVASREKTFINLNGNTGLSKGGSGDVLSGMIASFLAQGYPAQDAAVCGVYLHGAAADLLKESL